MFYPIFNAGLRTHESYNLGISPTFFFLKVCQILQLNIHTYNDTLVSLRTLNHYRNTNKVKFEWKHLSVKTDESPSFVCFVRLITLSPFLWIEYVLFVLQLLSKPEDEDENHIVSDKEEEEKRKRCFFLQFYFYRARMILQELPPLFLSKSFL